MPTRVAAILLSSVLLAAGCASASPPAASSSASALAAPSATPATGAPSPSLAATSVPGPSAGPTAFLSPIPMGPDVAWSSLTWRKLAAGDPLAQVRSIQRWRGGFVALGAPVPTGDTSRTPIWVSTDGGTWRALDAAVFGPGTIVTDIGQTGSGLVAMTLQGGKNQCDGAETPMNCWSLTLPFRAWTSSDGTTWTAHPGPAFALAAACDGCGIDAPLVRSGQPGVLAIALTGGGTERSSAQAAFSSDGIAWEILPSNALPAGFQVGDAAAVGSGFVIDGDVGDPARATALWSSDGRRWARLQLPGPKLGPTEGTTASWFAVATRGIIAVGAGQAVPGPELWWSSLDGQTWTLQPKFPPLGLLSCACEGNGLDPDGVLVGDGERLLAYRTDHPDVGWTSSDGRAWRPLAMKGGPLPASSEDPILLPVGVLWLGRDGSTWLGEPGA